MPMQWNDQADARLFANVLKLHAVKLDYPALARAMGGVSDVTPKAISHRISKIKEKAQAYRRNNPYYFDGTEGSTTASASSTAKSASKRRSKAKAENHKNFSDGGNDDEDSVKPDPTLKMEGEDEDDLLIDGYRARQHAVLGSAGGPAFAHAFTPFDLDATGQLRLGETRFSAGGTEGRGVFERAQSGYTHLPRTGPAFAPTTYGYEPINAADIQTVYAPVMVVQDMDAKQQSVEVADLVRDGGLGSV